ncbi:Transmembrane secretion effector [Butyrivibrio fibrisolvens DSM 3071]|uniref:Transmembrane secretion effector n=1 Tax=Butyrivibrio fibrisolvens DSM 3071 TaxID=1121131 RepID=A0A1M6DZL0_BUTFI|nr:MFS transporter [Butyrivibrio fibrisolvens]SHI78687.1 Transmembrane secretion effector [Butyrivibrio fibrisolvens DSM 3071]
MKKSTGYRAILHNYQYMKLLVAGIINRFGDSIDAIASAWLVYELTSNAMWSAIIFGVNKIPSVFIQPLAGAWVEGKKKKPIMVVTDLIRAICVAVIATGFLFGFLNAWIIVISTFVISTAEAFRLPAGSAIIPKLLKKEEIVYGTSLSTAIYTVVELIGMGAAAGIIALIGTTGAIYIDMVTFVLSALIIATIKISSDESRDINGSLQAYFDTLKQGFSYIARSKAAMFLVLFAAFLNAILVPLNSLMAPLANEVICTGAETISLISIAITCGTLLGTVIYPILSRFVSKEVFVISGGICIGLYYLAVIIARPLYNNTAFTYAYVAFISFIMGVFVSLLSAFLQVIFVELIDEQYFARAASIMNAMGNAATPVMSVVVSFLAAWLSTSVIFVVIGAIDVLVCLYLMLSHTLSDILCSKKDITVTSSESA